MITTSMAPTTTPTATFHDIARSLRTARYVADDIASTFTLKGGDLPRYDVIMDGVRSAREASELLWAHPNRTSDLWGKQTTDASILARKGADALERIAEGLGMEHGHLDREEQSVLAQTVLDKAFANVSQVLVDQGSI